MMVLEPLEKATVYLSAAQYPTIADIRFVFLGILNYLENMIGENEFTQNELASSVYQKINEYWNIINQQTLIPTVLDPRYKLSLFEDGTSATEATFAVTSILANYYNITAPENHETEEKDETPRQYFQRLKKQRLNYDNTSRRSSMASSVSNLASDELDRYLALQIDENVKPLLWWKAHEHEFPV